MMHVYGEISGTLSSPGKLSGSLSSPAKLSGSLTIPAATLPPSYEGSYEVTPRLHAQSLYTDGKLMEDDVTIFEIPVTITSNPHGGQTVLIG